jgi:LDH2 family malate/lactate/ureidoglycolate dehydrogenase
MNRYSKEELVGVVTQLAAAMGVPVADAELFAEVLVDADVSGVSTHGVSRLNIYLKRIDLGLIDPKATLKIDRQAGSVLVLDAGNGLGQIQARKALDLLMPMARQNGVATATIRNSQHFGALSWYANFAASQDMILLAMTNCEPAMSPEGGYEAFFGTNPIAASFPTGKGFPVKIDLATSGVARGNIMGARRRRECDNRCLAGVAGYGADHGRAQGLRVGHDGGAFQRRAFGRGDRPGRGVDVQEPRPQTGCRPFFLSLRREGVSRLRRISQAHR